MMGVEKTIQERRSFRSLKNADITPEIIKSLSEAARLAPSCFNNQPWNYVFVNDPSQLQKIFDSLSQGNDWAKKASMIIAVFSKEEDDCVIKDRVYHLFDVGLATGFLMLQATELGLVAHPIAGFNPKKVSEALEIPDDYQVITLLIIGKKSREINPQLQENQVETERQRPQRKNFSEFTHENRYNR